jgi:sugar phosphate isomerase/epimerase
MRDYTLDRYKEAFDLAAEWNCPYVVAIPGPVNSLINPPYDWMRKWFVEAMQELLEHSKDMDVQLLLENVPFTFLPTYQDMVGVAKEIGGDVAMNYDICNAAYIREDVGAAIRDMGALVKNVHMSDSGYEEFKHDRLGTGIVDPAPAAAALKEIGYDGYTILEIITDANQPGADPDGDIRASQKIIEEHGWEKI